MLKDLLECLDKQNKITGVFSQEDVDQICHMIMGTKPSTTDKPWLYEIVSNSRNSIDVDKFDYMKRDTKQLGHPFYCSFNERSLMNSARVIDGQICYPEREFLNLKNLFESRYGLYRDFYTDSATQSYECLLVDILNATKDIYFNFLEAIYDPKQFIDLDDSIIHRIRISDEPELKRARELVSRWDHQDSYPFVGEKILQKDHTDPNSDLTE